MAEQPDPEVASRPRRRRFSAEYKQTILAEYERCSEDGAKGALLRREGLYSSHITQWRQAREEGGLAALDRPRGRPRKRPAGPRGRAAAGPQRPPRGRAGHSPAGDRGPGKSLGAVGADLRQRTAEDRRRAEQVTDSAIAELVAGGVSTAAACAATGRPRATHYRRHPAAPRQPVHGPPTPRGPQPRALTRGEREHVLSVLHEPRFADLAPAQVYATLLDEGVYLASESTFYRLLRAAGEVRERRAQATHPPKVKPELVADAPNRCWSWDITKLPGPAKWTSYHLYVVIDIYSRYVVAWTVAERETSELAKTLLADAVAKQGVDRGQLTIHSDRGPSMGSKPVAHLLADLGVTKSHSRPHTSNDNPFSEAQFKTLKYFPTFPGSFGSVQDARAFCRTFFAHYNLVHRHSGIGLLTPADVHHGRAPQVRAARAAVLDRAYQTRPDRFVRHPPQPPPLPQPAWINRPDNTDQPAH